MTEIKIEGGKYVLGVYGDGDLFCLRNGALWLSDEDFAKGSKMLIALVHEHDDLANQLRDERRRHAAELKRRDDEWESVVRELSEATGVRHLTMASALTWVKSLSAGASKDTATDVAIDRADSTTPSGDVCKLCGAPEVEAHTPATKYACGSFDYDQRPGTFVDVCSAEGKEKMARLAELASKVDFSAFASDADGRRMTRVAVRIGRPVPGKAFVLDMDFGFSIPDYVFDGDGEVTPEAADEQAIKVLELVLGIIRAPKTSMNDEVF